MSTYTEIVRQSTWDGNTLRATAPADWGQGHTIFGGVIAGLALRALQNIVESERPLRSLLTAFVAPVRAGDIVITTQVLRAGRNVTHAEAKVMQDGTLRCSLLACYGRDRETPVHVAAAAMPELAAPEELTPAPFVPGISPQFTKLLDYRWTYASMPFLGNGSGTTDGWIRLREESRMGPDLFAILVDAWPTPALSMLNGPAPVSSLTWSLEIIELNPAHRADDWWRIHAYIDSAAAGYVYGDAVIWGPDGRLAARSRQTVSVYAPESTD